MNHSAMEVNSIDYAIVLKRMGDSDIPVECNTTGRLFRLYRNCQDRSEDSTHHTYLEKTSALRTLPMMLPRWGTLLT